MRAKTRGVRRTHFIHKRVESIEEIPKLKLSEKQSVGFAPLHNMDYLQEFQYGKDVFQTTTINDPPLLDWGR